MRTVQGGVRQLIPILLISCVIQDKPLTLSEYRYHYFFKGAASPEGSLCQMQFLCLKILPVL